MKNFFKELLEYTYTFNDKVIQYMIQNNNRAEKSVELINHTINSHQIWISRIENISVEIGVWDIRPIEDLKAINLANYQKTLAILDNLDLEKRITYTTTKGQTFESSIKDMLFHVVNHSTYHRGQIATDCKLHGIEPLTTDYIVWKEKKSNPEVQAYF